MWIRICSNIAICLTKIGLVRTKRVVGSRGFLAQTRSRMAARRKADRVFAPRSRGGAALALSRSSKYGLLAFVTNRDQMKIKVKTPAGFSANQPKTAAGIRIVLVVTLFFLLGLGAGALWFDRMGLRGGSRIVLSDGSTGVLKQLSSPVEIRFYSVLDPASVPDSTRTFSGRVAGWLSAFEQAADGKIKVVRHDSMSADDVNAAAADGIRPFNLDKGNACFLGVTVICGDRKESLPELQPEWEAALESDLARAIRQIAEGPAPVVVKPSAPISPDITNTVVRLIPDLKVTSLEDGTQILRAATLQEFTAAGSEMEAKLQAAQQQLADAQAGQSVEKQQTAMKQVQDLQLAQGEKYKELSARLELELKVFQQMKASDGSK